MKGHVLREVLRWCTHHKNASPLPNAGESRCVDRVFSTDIWDHDFYKDAKEMQIEILVAADFMEIERLFQYGCKTIATETIQDVQLLVLGGYKKKDTPDSEVNELLWEQQCNNDRWKKIQWEMKATGLRVLSLHQAALNVVLDYILDCSALSVFFLLTRCYRSINARRGHEIRFAQLRTVKCDWHGDYGPFKPPIKLGFVNGLYVFALYFDTHSQRDFYVWSLEERRVVFSKKSVYNVAVDPWGRLVITDTDHQLHWLNTNDWQMTQPEKLASLGSVYATPDFLAFLPSRDAQEHPDTWDSRPIWYRIENLEPYRVEPVCPPETRFFRSPRKKGAYIIYVTDVEIALKTMQDDRTIVLLRMDWLQSLSFEETRLSISPDGTSVAIIQDGDVLLYWIESRDANFHVSEDNEIYRVPQLENDTAVCVVHSPDSRYFAIITKKGRVVICRTQKEAVRELLIDEGIKPKNRNLSVDMVFAAASWSENQEILVVGSHNGWKTIDIQNMIRVVESK